MAVNTTRMQRGKGALRFLLVSAAALGLFVGGIALAEWKANGAGNGRARGGAVVAITATEAEPTSVLYPGATGDVALTITNPNNFPLVVYAITGAGTISASDATCDANHGVSFTDQVGSWPVAANDTTSVTLSDAAAMALSSDDSCQGAAFTIPVSLQSGAGTGESTETYSYYTGPPATENVGQCQSGTVDGDGNVIDPEVTPTTEELDENDNDCDGQVDEDLVGPDTYADADSDGYGDPSVVQPAVAAGGQWVPADGYVWDNTDCNDSTAAVNPGASDVDGDEIDSDCDGLDT